MTLVEHRPTPRDTPAPGRPDRPRRGAPRRRGVWRRDPFLSEDPIGVLGRDFNLYVYVQGNPLNFSDPFGLTTYKNFPPLERILVEQAVENVKTRLLNECCAGAESVKLYDRLESATIEFKPYLNHCGEAGAFGLIGKGKTIKIGGLAFHCNLCDSLEETIIHEVAHLVGHGERGARSVEGQCTFGPCQ